MKKKVTKKQQQQEEEERERAAWTRWLDEADKTLATPVGYSSFTAPRLRQSNGKGNTN